MEKSYFQAQILMEKFFRHFDLFTADKILFKADSTINKSETCNEISGLFLQKNKT